MTCFKVLYENSKAKMLPPVPTILFRLFTLALFYINSFNHLMLGWFGLVVWTQPSGEVVRVVKQIPFHNGKIPQFQNPLSDYDLCCHSFSGRQKKFVLVGPDVFSWPGLWRLRTRGQPCWNKNLASCRDSFVKGQFEVQYANRAPSFHLFQ